MRTLGVREQFYGRQDVRFMGIIATLCLRLESKRRKRKRKRKNCHEKKKQGMSGWYVYSNNRFTLFEIAQLGIDINPERPVMM
jgi:hypothetical protein